MSRTVMAKLFSIELLMCASDGKSFRIQTLHLANVVSFTCVCQCGAKFATFKEVQDHMSTAHPAWEGICFRAIQSEADVNTWSQASSLTDTHARHVENNELTDYNNFRDESVDHSNHGNNESVVSDDGHVRMDMVPSAASQAEINIGPVHAVVSIENERYSDFVEPTIVKLNTEADQQCQEADDVKKLCKKTRPTLGDFACTFCPKTFPSEMGLSNHLRVHKNEAIYQCTECSVPFTNRRSLEEHVRQHPGYKPFVCSICSTSVIRYKSLVKHFMKKHGNAAYHCVLLQHKRLKSGCQECKYCGKSFQPTTEVGDQDCILSEPGNEISIDSRESVNMEIQSLLASLCAENASVGNHSPDSEVGSSSMLVKSVQNSSDVGLTEPVLCDSNISVGNTAQTTYSHVSRLAVGVVGVASPGMPGQCLASNLPISITMIDIDHDYIARHQDSDNIHRLHDADIDTGSDPNKAKNLESDEGVDMLQPSQPKKGSAVRRDDEKSTNLKKTNAVFEPIVCPFCDKEFPSNQSLGTHLRIHTNETTYKCDICSEAFVNRLEFEIHIREHPGYTPFICGECGLSYALSRTLQKHMKSKHNLTMYHHKSAVIQSHVSFQETKTSENTAKTLEVTPEMQTLMHGQSSKTEVETSFKTCTSPSLKKKNVQKETYGKPSITTPSMADVKKQGMLLNYTTYQCSECCKIFLSQQGLDKHASSHPWFMYRCVHDKPYKCTECHDKFVSATELSQHTFDHHLGFQPFSCYQCESKFPSREEFLDHQQQSHAGGLFACSVCKKTTTTGASLRKHVKMHTKPYQCEQCEKKFASPGSLRDHMTIHSRVKAIACDICDKCFRTDRRYQAHRRTHLNNRQFVCTACRKGFNHKYSLTVHLKSHMAKKDQPHQCKVCLKRFLKLSSLQAHERTHTGEKPFICDLCGATFVGSGSLHRHRRRHKGEFLYQCDRCGKGCVDHSTLISHTRTHTNEKLHKCPICGKAFSIKQSVTRCMKMHSSERIHCHICDKGFVADGELRKHMKMKHA